MHPRVGSATLSQLAFPAEGNPNIAWEKSHWDNTVVKKVKRKCSQPYLNSLLSAQNSWLVLPVNEKVARPMELSLTSLTAVNTLKET